MRQKYIYWYNCNYIPIAWRKHFRQCLDLLAGMHWRPYLLVLQAGWQKIPVPSAQSAHLGIVLIDKDGEPAQIWWRCGLGIRPGSRTVESFCAQQHTCNLGFSWCCFCRAKLRSGPKMSEVSSQRPIPSMPLQAIACFAYILGLSLFLAGTGKTFLQLWSFQFNTCSLPIFHVEFLLVLLQNQHFACSELSAKEKTGFLTMKTAMSTRQHYYDSLHLRK